MMKFCVDCKYWSPSNRVTDKQLQVDFSKCHHPEIATYDLISGEKEVKYARTMREQNCGYDGVLWEAKPQAEPQSESHPVPAKITDADPPPNELGILAALRRWRA